jgi:hypothetical protein
MKRMNVWTRPGLVVLAAASLAACDPPKPAAPPPPSTAYAKVMPVATAAPGRGQCLNEQEAQTVRARIVQQELAYAARACNMTGQYNQFAGKFDADLKTNGNQLTALLRRRGININSHVTDITNKAATRATSYAGFCNDAREAYRWALQPSTTSLSAVPPLYDNAADHSTKPCIQPPPRR